MDIRINNKAKYSSFKIRARRFIVRSKWKRERDIAIGDYIVVTDPKETSNFLHNMKVIGHMPGDKIVAQGSYIGGMFSTLSLTADQCTKLKPEIHTLQWKQTIYKINDLKV